MSDSKAKGLFVGLGGIGSQMLNVLQEKPWFVLEGVVDPRDEALERAGTAFGTPKENQFRDLKAALNGTKANVAFINTPSELHFEQSKSALEAGLDVLVAKPVTNNYEQALALVELAAERNRMLAVGQQIRFNRHYRAVQTFLRSGEIGNVESVLLLNSKPRPQALNLANMDHPALYENACHHFDALLALFPDADPEWVVCDGFKPSWSPYRSYCMANALIRFSKGIHVVYHCGFSAQADCYELRLEGSEGVLRCRGKHMSNPEMRYEVAPRGGAFVERDLEQRLSTENPWHAFFDLWHDHLHGGGDVPFSGRNNLKVFAMLSAGIASIESGRPVEVAGNPQYDRAFN